MRHFACLLLVLCPLLWAAHASAQPTEPAGDVSANALAQPTKAGDAFEVVTPTRGFTQSSAADDFAHARVMSIAVLVYSTIIISLLVSVAFRSGQWWTPMSFKLTALTIIISASLFLMTAGYNENQLTPVIGLFGTIAGYILGQGSSALVARQNSSPGSE